MQTKPVLLIFKLKYILKMAEMSSLFIVKQTDWCNILGSHKTTNRKLYETSTHITHKPPGTFGWE